MTISLLPILHIQAPHLCKQNSGQTFMPILKSFLKTNTMQDILDSGFDVLGLSAMPNSRSASMKKINKKQNNSSLRVDNNSTLSRGSFDLATSFTNKQSRQFSHDNSSVNTTKRINHDVLDMGFGDISSPKGSPKASKFQENGNQRSSIGHSISQFDILGEDHGINHHFGNTQKSIVNPSKGSESFVSSRNMKPPLRPKDNWSSSLNFGSAAVVIPQEDPTLTNSSNGFNKSNSLRKRSSIDARSELNDDVFPINNNRTHGSSLNSYNNLTHDSVKEDFLSNIHKSESCVIEGKNDSEGSSNFFQARGKLQSKSQSMKVGGQDQKKSCVNCQKNKLNEKEISSHYEKQIDLVKNTYQKQIEYLQQCLEKQIGENRALRAQFLEEANKTIQEERNRNAKIHEEQVNRLKQIFGWQQKKQQDAYEMEINSLKASLGLASQQREWIKNNQQPSSYNLQLLQNQLQTKELRLQTKIKSIEQRQLELDTRQSELSLRMRREDDKLRSQEKRIMEMEGNFKKRMLEEKKYLSSEKQQLAMESGNMESELMKMKEKLIISQKEAELERQALEQDRHTLEMLNHQAMNKHKANLQQIQRQKQRLNELQVELVKKMRIVEMRAKELSYQCNNHEDVPSKKINSNWLDNSFSKTSELKDKKLHGSNSMSHLNKTKQRFYNLEHNVKTRLNLSMKENKKVDLSGYITRVENNRHRHA